MIQVPWGVEVTWALLTPENGSIDSTIKNIVLGSVYSKPKSKKKTATLDHISETYNFLSTKYGRGCYWMLAGDTNDLKLDAILNLSPNLKSLVKKPTRRNPDSILDNIITDMVKWYQSPDCLEPLDADPGTGGKPSDHLIVIMEPISVINNKPARTYKEITIRPLKQSGIDMFGEWLKKQDWKEIFDVDSVDDKAEIFQTMLL